MVFRTFSSCWISHLVGHGLIIILWIPWIPRGWKNAEMHGQLSCPILNFNPLPSSYLTVRHGKWPIYRWFTYYKWWFSMAMLNNQRYKKGSHLKTALYIPTYSHFARYFFVLLFATQIPLIIGRFLWTLLPRSVRWWIPVIILWCLGQSWRIYSVKGQMPPSRTRYSQLHDCYMNVGSCVEYKY